ncbi:hypothetical protein G7046_g1910 [Stylonectria norvegica]|nr:hypothetical protein G7046_g1910 [Stylonectria norvegica]
MLEVRCRGTPFEIGYQHGHEAKSKVHGSLAFYRALFQSSCGLDWDAVRLEAAKFIPPLEQKHARYLEEMRGIAKGADTDFIDILALNVRSEITFGLFTAQPDVDVKLDGCTSLAYKRGTDGLSFIAQNWDWMVEQMPDIFVCHVSQPDTGLPDFTMVTEGGVIGKIGLNSNGVGVCLNAIRARGVAFGKLPIHLALRAVLESSSRDAAIQTLMAFGVAASAHILVGDQTGSTGLECTSLGIKTLEADKDGVITHSNHLLLHHSEVDEPPWLLDSPARAERMRKLIKQSLHTTSDLDTATLVALFKDEDGYPGSINRHQVGDSETETLFTIVMHLDAKSAVVSFGRPTRQIDQARFAY